MHKIIRVFHILGVVLFFGSILGHAVVGLAEHTHDSPQALLLTRQIVDVATWYLTLPGLLLLVLSGVGLIIYRERPMRYLAAHLFIAILILANAIFILFPVGQAMLGAASGGAINSVAEIQVLEGREAMFGVINILLCLAAVFIGVLKPGDNKNS